MTQPVDVLYQRDNPLLSYIGQEGFAAVLKVSGVPGLQTTLQRFDGTIVQPKARPGKSGLYTVRLQDDKSNLECDVPTKCLQVIVDQEYLEERSSRSAVNPWGQAASRGSTSVADVLQSVCNQLRVKLKEFMDSCSCTKEEAFQEFDLNNDGQLDSDELFLGLLRMGVQLTRQEMGLVFPLFEVNDGGEISLAEFIDFVNASERSEKPQRTANKATRRASLAGGNLLRRNSIANKRILQVQADQRKQRISQVVMSDAARASKKQFEKLPEVSEHSNQPKQQHHFKPRFTVREQLNKDHQQHLALGKLHAKNVAAAAAIAAIAAANTALEMMHHAKEAAVTAKLMTSKFFDQDEGDEEEHVQEDDDEEQRRMEERCISAGVSVQKLVLRNSAVAYNTYRAQRLSDFEKPRFNRGDYNCIIKHFTGWVKTMNHRKLQSAIERMNDIAGVVRQQHSQDTPPLVVKYVIFQAWLGWYRESKARREAGREGAQRRHREHAAAMAASDTPHASSHWEDLPEWVLRLTQQPGWWAMEAKRPKRPSETQSAPTSRLTQQETARRREKKQEHRKTVGLLPMLHGALPEAPVAHSFLSLEKKDGRRTGKAKNNRKNAPPKAANKAVNFRQGSMKMGTNPGAPTEQKSDVSVTGNGTAAQGSTRTSAYDEGVHDEPESAEEEYDEWLVREWQKAEDGEAEEAEEVTMRLAMMYPQDAHAREEFMSDFVCDVAAALAVEPNRIVITSVAAGSIMVQLAIKGAGAKDLKKELQVQMRDKSSMLYAGKVTRHVTNDVTSDEEEEGQGGLQLPRLTPQFTQEGAHSNDNSNNGMGLSMGNVAVLKARMARKKKKASKKNRRNSDVRRLSALGSMPIVVPGVKTRVPTIPKHFYDNSSEEDEGEEDGLDLIPTSRAVRKKARRGEGGDWHQYELSTGVAARVAALSYLRGGSRESSRGNHWAMMFAGEMSPRAGAEPKRPVPPQRARMGPKKTARLEKLAYDKGVRKLKTQSAALKEFDAWEKARKKREADHALRLKLGAKGWALELERRQMDTDRKLGAIRIQGAVRIILAKNAVCDKKIDKAVRAIQGMIRARRARKQAHERKRKGAAIKIQSRGRAAAAGRLLQRKVRTRALFQAAAAVQTLARQKLAADEVRRLRHTQNEVRRKTLVMARRQSEIDMKRKKDLEDAAAWKKLEEDQKMREEHDKQQKAKDEKAAREKAAVEEKARKEAEEKARKEAEEKAKKEAEEQARKEAEEQAKKEAEEQAKREAEEQAKRRVYWEQHKKEAEEKVKKDA
jgi:hypothetical protein